MSRVKVDDGFLKCDGFTGSIEFNDDDCSYYGRVTNVTNKTIKYAGRTMERLKQAFEDAIESTCRKSFSR